MSNPLRIILFAILAIAVCIGAAWQHMRHFDVDIRAYFILACLSLAFMLGATLYEFIRKDPSIGSMLFGIGFLLIFGATLNTISYFGLTVAGPRIDKSLAAIDRALGVNWSALVLYAVSHPMMNDILQVVYRFSIYETLLLVLWWGLNERTRLSEQLCLALIVGGTTTIGIWIIAPSFGAFTVYPLPPSPIMKSALALNPDYAQSLIKLWTDGPGHISPATIKGLVGFPSFHTAQAIIVTWYARKAKYLFYPLFAFNTVVILSTPIQGGHHVVDAVGGFAVAAFAIWLAILIAKRVTTVEASKEALPALAAAS